MRTLNHHFRPGVRCLAMAFATFVLCTTANAGATLTEVRQRGQLNCGVSQGLAGFSANIEDKGWQGFDVDFCRAVAAAVLGDSEKVTYVPLSAAERFDALRGKKIDILSRNTTWTMSRDVVGDMEFVGITYFDGQGFLAPASAGLSSAQQLASGTVCALDGTTTADNAKRYFTQLKLTTEIILFKSRDEALASYAAGKCDAYTADRSALASQRTKLDKPDKHVLLPEVISKEPLGPVVRQGDDNWRDLVQWVLFLLINAEEEVWTAQTAGDVKAAPRLTVPAKVSARLGLEDGWARRVIAAVGHYGEIFDRHLGRNSALKIDRGVNALWTRGGILYVPPIR